MIRKNKKISGQSLVEFALSVPILIILFSGAVDLGRAYFAQIQLQSAISEGLHWGTSYPVCIGNIDNYVGGTHPECQQSNAINERILNEDAQLNRNDYLCVQATVIGTNPNNPSPGDDLELKTKFRVKLITPIMSGLFGDWIYLYASAREVIRGKMSNLPDIAPIAMDNQGGITPGCSIP